MFFKELATRENVFEILKDTILDDIKEINLLDKILDYVDYNDYTQYPNYKHYCNIKTAISRFNIYDRVCLTNNIGEVDEYDFYKLILTAPDFANVKFINLIDNKILIRLVCEYDYMSHLNLNLSIQYYY